MGDDYTGQEMMRIGDDYTDFLNKEMEDNIMKIVKSLEESGLMIKGVSKTIQNEVKKQKVDFCVC